MDYSKVEVPALYAEAIEKAMAVNNVPLSKVRIKQVVEQCPDTHKDNLAAQYAFRAYKAQHKRVNKVQALLQAASRVLDTCADDSPAYEELTQAVGLFMDSTTEGTEA